MITQKVRGRTVKLEMGSFSFSIMIKSSELKLILESIDYVKIEIIFSRLEKITSYRDKGAEISPSKLKLEIPDISPRVIKSKKILSVS